MKIRIQRRSNHQHHLAIERDDGSGDSALLESKSLLVHDLVHYALEAELGLADGFWGAVASGRSFAALRAVPFGDAPGLARVERLVGPLQSVFHGRLAPAVFLAQLRAGGDAEAAALVDEAVVVAVLERMRRLWGRWRATGFHEELVLDWPPVERTAGSGAPLSR